MRRGGVLVRVGRGSVNNGVSAQATVTRGSRGAEPGVALTRNTGLLQCSCNAAWLSAALASRLERGAGQAAKTETLAKPTRPIFLPITGAVHS